MHSAKPPRPNLVQGILSRPFCGEDGDRESGWAESVIPCWPSHASLSPLPPGAAVQAWDARRCVRTWGRAGVVCVLVIFSHPPLFSPH